jgi:hypothetical protein
MTLRFRSSVALLLALSLAAPTSFAQKKPNTKAEKPKTIREELPANAQRDWDAAKDLFESSDFAGALVEYKRAYEQSKNPRVLYNVAICEKNLRHYAQAAEHLKQEMAEAGGKLQPEEEQRVKDAIGTLEPFVSTLDVQSNEPGATLFVDDQEAGKTPFDKPLPIDVGPHTLRLHKDGFKDVTQNVTIAGGAPAKAAFTIEPAVKKSHVEVTVTGAPTANIVIDGVDMGLAPFKGDVTAGRHTFEAQETGFVTARQTSDVVYGQPLNLSLELAPERHEGRVRIATTPETATIEIDGKVVGSGSWEGPLPTGGHQLIVKKPGYVTYTTEISLNDDQQRDVKATLLEEKSSASVIAWIVGGALVVGGGAVAGYFLFKPSDQQPVNGTLDPGLATAGFRRH